MALIALIIHITVVVCLSIHVMTSHRSLYWLPALILVPLIASLVYFLAVCLPEIRFERRVRQLAAVAEAKASRPAGHAKTFLDYAEVPSLVNRLRLAASLLDRGVVEEALRHYEDCLAGPFGDDPEVRLGAARALLMSGQPDRAADLLTQLREPKKSARCPQQESRFLAQA